MSPKLMALALRKQRLQLRAEQQRADLLAGLAVLDGVLDQVDRLREGVGWLRRHAPVVSTIALLLLVLRPRFTVRWFRRGWLGWQLYRRVRGGLESALAAL
jgi:YqjK-like protein